MMMIVVMMMLLLLLVVTEPSADTQGGYEKLKHSGSTTRDGPVTGEWR